MGLFSAIKSGLAKTRDALMGELKGIVGAGKITDETLEELEEHLIKADVGVEAAFLLTDALREQALGKSLTTEQVLDIMRSEAERLLKDPPPFELKGKPHVVLVIGVNGAGKTTTIGKLAARLKDEGKKVMIAACDTFRPAAMEQLRVLADQVQVPCYIETAATDPVKVAQAAIQEAKAKGYDVVIIDTAGRQSIDEELMQQISDIKDAITPDEILLVVDSMTGQDAVNTAKTFNERLDIHGVILTKLDGDTRGGAALSIRTVVDKPIKFIGTGEKMEALDVFHPERMADRILGMGDVVSLVERAQEQFDLEEAKRLQKKIAKNKFDFDDFLGQIQQIKKMGNIKDLASMIPGVGKAIKDIDVPDDAFKGIEAIIQSMTPYERRNPEVLNVSRKQRIAKGSGTNIQEVNRLIKQFDQMRKMMRMLQGNKMANMAKMAGMMGGMKGGFPGMPKI